MSDPDDACAYQRPHRPIFHPTERRCQAGNQNRVALRLAL